MFFVYIIYSSQLQKYYVGSTQDVETRLIRHNQGHSSFTKTGIPWVLVYKESFPTRALAVKREKFIKSQKSVPFIKKMIALSSDD